jgi:branched-subunit amino acid transport protein
VSAIELILSMAAGIFALRLAGLALADHALPPTLERALGFVPVATLTALVVSSLAGRPDEAPSRLTAAVAAGVVARRFGRAWLCIIVGLAVYWTLRLLAW